MWTPEQFENMIIDRLKQSVDLNQMLEFKGDVVRPGKRVPDSVFDIVVGNLSLTDGDVQLGLANATIWVKDVPNKLPAPHNKTVHVIDQNRIDGATAAIVEVLNGNRGYYFENGVFFVENIGNSYANPDTKEHFQPIRIRARLHSTES